MENTEKDLSSIEFCKQIGAYTSNFILFLRKSRFIKQKPVANKLGISVQQLMKYEAGINKISLGKLIVLCNFLEYDIRDFIEELINLGSNINVKTKGIKTFENVDKLTSKQYKIINELINAIVSLNK